MSLELLVLGTVIGANNLATALALGALGQAHRRWRIVGVFVLFEFLVPLAGIWMGRQAASAIESWAQWLGPALIATVGLWTIAAVLREDIDAEALARRAADWSGLALLAAMLSLDNLIVGFSLGLGRRDPLLIATTIAIFSAAFSWSGLHVGRFVRETWRRAAEIGSGLLLLGLAAVVALGWI